MRSSTVFLILDPGQYGGQQSMSDFLLEEKLKHLDMKTKVKNFLKVFKDKAGVILSSYFQQIPKSTTDLSFNVSFQPQTDTASEPYSFIVMQKLLYIYNIMHTCKSGE